MRDDEIPPGAGADAPWPLDARTEQGRTGAMGYEARDLFTHTVERPELPRRGYRLQRLEIRNFGGYHGPASVFRFDLKGAVFSGENGAGKSTAIDAYRMLFRTQPRFNSATEGVKDRTAETYYIGQYGKIDGPGGGRPLHLREYGVREGFMAICGVFATDDGEVFSILRMAFYPRKGEAADWRLVTARGDISIERDFPDWPTKGVCSRNAQALGGELHPGYREFFAAIGAAFGIEDPSQASEAFKFIDQSIGVKKLSSIVDFARTNIFPHNSLRKSADGAIAAFEEVQAATRQVERTEAMIANLETVVRRFAAFERALGAHAEAVSRKMRFLQFENLLHACSKARIAKRRAKELEDLRSQLDEAKATIETAEAEIAAIDRRIREEGFDQVNQMRNEHQKLLVKIEEIDARLKGFAEMFRAAGLPFAAETEVALDASFARVERRIEELGGRIRENTEKKAEADYALRDAVQARRDAAETLKSLLENNTSVPARLLEMRRVLAGHLGLRDDDLPFVAELAQVRHADLEWEGVANRVLGGLGCEVLVDDEHVREARRFINSRHWSTRVVLREVANLKPADVEGPHPDALARKIEIKPGERFSQVARVLIDRAADHTCLSQEAFSTTRLDRAVTQEGSVKAGRRIIKDDRHRVDDRASYVLGWNIEDRIQLARSTLAEREADERRLERQMEEFEDGLKTLGHRRDAANRLLGGKVSFAEVDRPSRVAEAGRLEAQIKALDTNEAQALRDRRAAAARRQQEAQADTEALNRKIGSAENTVSSANAEVERRKDDVRANAVAHSPMTYENRRYYLEVARRVNAVPAGRTTFNYVLSTREADLDRLVSEMREEIQVANNSEANITRRASEAQIAAHDFARAFPEIDLETTVTARIEEHDKLSRSRGIREEWRATLERLKLDDLPRHKQNFESRRRTFAAEAIQQIRSESNAYARHISRLEHGFNAILSRMTYDPAEGTRARLRIRPNTESAAIAAFRAKLERAESVIFSEDPGLIERVTQELIDEIRVEGDSKQGLERRDTILDLRNWHEMDVEEYYVDENGDYREQRRFYAGRDGASGGQGERLTMLLIGAAMVYTFGANDETRPGVGLQTIILDEAFMHGSEETAAAATEVLDAMGLQVIAATPVQKLQAFAGKTERVFIITKRNEQIHHTDTTYAALEAEEARIAEEFEVEANARA